MTVIVGRVGCGRCSKVELSFFLIYIVLNPTLEHVWTLYANFAFSVLRRNLHFGNVGQFQLSHGNMKLHC